MKLFQLSRRIAFEITAVAAIMVSSSVIGQEIEIAEKTKDVELNEVLADVAKELQSRMQAGQPPPQGTVAPTIDRRNKADEPTNSEQIAILDSSVLKFLNLGLKELRQPSISMNELGSFDLQELPKEYFIVLDRQGDQQALSEWINGEFLRIRGAKWESWRPANKLLKENIITGKMLLSEPDHKFVVLLMDDGDLRSALLKIKGRVWAINISRKDGLSPVIPLVPEKLFFEHLRDDENKTGD